MLSSYGRNEWLTILAVGALLALATLIVGLWWLSILIVLFAAALVLFFRDPERAIPSQRNAVVAPADGRVSSIHQLDHFEPFDGPALCIRIFLSVFDVHMNRSPCHGAVASISHQPGQHLSALNPHSAEANESATIVLVHPVRRHPVAAVRQVAGQFARTIVCAVREDQVLQRGERFGMIKLGSTTELYLPLSLKPEPQVQQGQKVQAGSTVLANVTQPESAARPISADDEDTSDHDTTEAESTSQANLETQPPHPDADVNAPPDPASKPTP